MQILSPYGKSLERELHDVYHLPSITALVELVEDHVATAYGFSAITVRSIHVAYGLAVHLEAQGQSWVLKFASHSMHAHPDEMFPWLHYARLHGQPLPQIVPTRTGAWYANPLGTQDYDVVYLMEWLAGTPTSAMDKHQLNAYMQIMAAFHACGRQYGRRVAGSRALWSDKWRECHETLASLRHAQRLPEPLLAQAEQIIAQALPVPLSQTILHGDFRLCHVFFRGDGVTGLIDVDQSTTGDRLIDLCWGLVSGPHPASGSLLTYAAIQQGVQAYHRQFPLTQADQATLRAAFLMALVEQVADLYQFVQTGAAATTEADICTTETLFQTFVERDDPLISSTAH